VDRDSLAFQVLADDDEVFDAFKGIAERHGLTEMETREVRWVRWSRPEPVIPVPPPPPTPQIWTPAPYRLAVSRPTRIKFVGEVRCWTAPDPSAPVLTFKDEREVDVFEGRETEDFGLWWLILRKTLPSGALFELWIPAAEFVFINPLV
jgi:hypothetical protein